MTTRPGVQHAIDTTDGGKIERFFARAVQFGAGTEYFDGGTLKPGASPNPSDFIYYDTGTGVKNKQWQFPFFGDLDLAFRVSYEKTAGGISGFSFGWSGFGGQFAEAGTVQLLCPLNYYSETRLYVQEKQPWQAVLRKMVRNTGNTDPVWVRVRRTDLMMEWYWSQKINPSLDGTVYDDDWSDSLPQPYTAHDWVRIKRAEDPSGADLYEVSGTAGFTVVHSWGSTPRTGDSYVHAIKGWWR